ncbi:MAG: DEAD/DEAH box helicase, partial [Phycisphaerae bacterium]|nr:DEAD/DEAH box helicase [Phycisphaerae bacterium]
MPVNFDLILQNLTSDPEYRGQIVHVRRLPAREARCGELSVPLDPILEKALLATGIERFYIHQSAASDLVGQGKDIVVVTGTASGKTLCYNLPILSDLLANPDARALYLFPTKALAQDQLGVLHRWADADPAIAEVLRPATYDGDTPSQNRKKIRNSASIILSNPDMLHVGVLPYHPRWASFLRNLKYVVVDELHTYRGIFGSNVALVMRRLARVCAHYGARPRFICASATVANPGELASRVVGRECEVIDTDGSPRGERLFVFWNPPPLSRDTLARRSANVEAQELLTHLVRQKIQTIVFTKARVVAELIYRYAREELERKDKPLAKRVRAYRGGYLPNERRRIEKALFSGRLLGVCSTNALELGIDVGTLDASILVGFPGTIASTWQQAGRAGRK